MVMPLMENRGTWDTAVCFFCCSHTDTRVPYPPLAGLLVLLSFLMSQSVLRRDGQKSSVVRGVSEKSPVSTSLVLRS
jgi:hypothetical protein